MEVVRYGRFAVFDRGEPGSHREAQAHRPRYAVIEHVDVEGPILRAGPFYSLGIAVDFCQRLNLRAEIKEAS
jgi:hypothetical protein